MPRLRNNPAAFSNVLLTVITSRRRRTARRLLREAHIEQAEREQYRRELAIAQQLGFVDRQRPRNQDHQQDRDQDLYDPHSGSYANHHIDVHVADLPSASHAAYHQSRRFAEERDRISQTQTELLPPDTCKCPESDCHTRKVDLIDITY